MPVIDASHHGDSGGQERMLRFIGIAVARACAFHTFAGAFLSIR